jgi:acetyltransferase-like isoleucine patch superfamily enzyme
LGYGTILDAPKGSNLTLGNRVKIMNNVVIATSMSICIGANTQIAEFTSVRDSDHGVSLGESMRDQLISEPLLIGTDVWIGRGVAVLRGSGVGDGAVVGANSVVKHYIPSLGIAVGAPAKVIRLRTQEGEVR